MTTVYAIIAIGSLAHSFSVPFFMPQVSLDQRVAKDASQVIDRVVDGEALLIHLKSGSYFSLNSVGTRIWENLDGSKTVEDLADVIVAEYDVSNEQAQTDVLNLVSVLIEEELAVPV